MVSPPLHKTEQLVHYILCILLNPPFIITWKRFPFHREVVDNPKWGEIPQPQILEPRVKCCFFQAIRIQHFTSKLP